MTKRKNIVWATVLIVLLTGSIIVCAIRWQAWFVNPPVPAVAGDTISYHFRTFATCSPCLADSVTRILLLGDVHNDLTHEEYIRMAQEAAPLTAYAQAGDFVEQCSPYYFQALYRELKDTPFDTLPIINCPGNHEYNKGIQHTLPALWYETFPQPQNGPMDFVGSTYYVDFPNLRFIVLDTNGLQWLHQYTRTLTWLNGVMAQAQKESRFIVVMMHHPVYSAAVGRFNIGVFQTFAHALQQADIVFSGHDHTYARRLPFITTTSTTKHKISKVNPCDTRIASCHRCYEVLSVVTDTLCVQTRLLKDSAESVNDNVESMVYDEIRIIKNAEGYRQCIDLYKDSTEFIDLPARYEGHKDIKVRRFLNRKAHRLSEKESL